MGQTLTNGIYLPAEGERNCYEGLAANWTALDSLIGGYNVHISNTTIHVTAEDKTKWDAVTSKADDSDVVHTSGNEIISGDKVFNNRLIKNIDVVLGTAPSTSKFSNIEIADNNKASLLQIMSGVYASGQSYARFFVQNKTADDGSGLSPTGTLIGCGFTISLPASSTSEGLGSITPRANKTTDFGLSGYQWRNVWCEKLYLNGTQLDPSAFALDANVVHSTGDETVNGVKTFSSGTQIYNANSSKNTPSMLLRTSKVSRGSTTDGSDNISLMFNDSGNSLLSSVRCTKLSNGTTQLRNIVVTTDVSNNIITYETQLSISKNGDKSFIPSEDNNVSLGKSGNKWKDVNTYLVNGLTPSSLGMPTDNASNIIDISSYITVLDGLQPNTYLAPSNGYIGITMSGCSGIQAYITGFWGGQIVRPTVGAVRFFMPICKNMTANILVFGGTVDNAKFFPCQGNI